MQEALFYETFEDALAAVIRALGGTKVVGNALRPEKGAVEAGKWVADCCNPDRRDKFDQAHIAWIRREGRKVGCHILATFEAREAGYADPIPVDPEDEAAKLQRAFIQSVQQQSQILTRLEAVTRQIGGFT